MTTEADIDDPSGEAPPSAERRGPAGPRTVPEADTFRFDGVDQPGGPDDRPDRRNMTLVFDERGIETSGRETRHHAFVPWSQVVGVTFGAEVDGPDGGVETPIEVESTGGPAHYVVRSDHPLAVMVPALEEQVSRWAAATPDEPDPTASSGLVTAWAPPPPRHPPPVAQPAAQPAGPGAPSPWPPPAAVDPALAGFLLAPPGLESPTGHPRPVPYSVGPYGPDGAPADPAHRKRTHRKRTHRTATLVVALCLLVSGIGLAVGLSLSSATGGQEVGDGSRPPDRSATGPGADADQSRSPRRLAGGHRCRRRSDIARRAAGPGSDHPGPGPVHGDHEGSGGHGPRWPGARPDGSGRLADLHSSHGVRVRRVGGGAPDGGDRGPQPPRRAGRLRPLPQRQVPAVRGDGVGGRAPTGRGPDLGGNRAARTGHRVARYAARFDRRRAVRPADGVHRESGEASVPVQVESISLGSDRVEASLQVFAIGGTIPDVSASFSTFEQRVASGGKSSEV